MSRRSPNTQIVELALGALGDLADQLVLVGGCAVDFLITDDAHPPVRHTIDVDLVAEMYSLSAYYRLDESLRQRGFVNDSDVTCRFRHGELILDIMPSAEEALPGICVNRWYPLVVSSALQSTLPSGRQFQHISAPLFLAAKIEAFYSRGEGDYGHHDIEDIVNVIDGRIQICEDIDASDARVRGFLRDEVEAILATPTFHQALPRHFHPDAASQARIPALITKLRRIAGI